MLGVERPHRANRKPNSVERQSVEFAQGAELRVRGPACAHIIFGVDLEKAHGLRARNDVGKMLRLEADTAAQRKAGCVRQRHGDRSWQWEEGGAGRRARASRKAYDLIAVSDPVPFGVFMVAQVPLATYFHALP
jgi:hypothetical protein